VGVADAETGTDQLARLAGFFNRSDIPVVAAVPRPVDPQPGPRETAKAMIDDALGFALPVPIRDHSQLADEAGSDSVTVLALGPLTRLAEILTADQGPAYRIDRVVVSGDPNRADDWNLGFDRAALEVVRDAGLELVFVRPGPSGSKPSGWYTDRLEGGQRTALGETLLDRMLDQPASRQHYLEVLSEFHDELAVLYLLHPELFRNVGRDVVEPHDAQVVAKAIAAELSRGRQRKQRVVFTDGPLPAESLRSDVQQRREAILANNGPDEWFAQLLLNELHEHLGAYSIIGVKMGLRAAELLNAPQHEMTIASSAPAAQPVSCLNDGLLVATGSTPGRGLFSHSPGPPGTVEAEFAYNGHSVTLRLKKVYQERIRTTIQALLTHTTLEDDAYWQGVRELGLDIWQNWHRRELFEQVLPEMENPETRRTP
jgi:pyrimidine-specific ribonucleoside hydrolase